ncbi:MFS transporter [Dactylosporangium sp. NPDC051484]|uniref:MFS transporter n=1 Tax=Dactylosporangium sp. NPDC051484 TaxID=3154942 RepID=UPI00344FF4AF
MLDHRRANLALAALSIATFTFVTTEVLPVGLLTLMADDLHRSRSQVGLLMTGYAVVVMLTSLPLARITQRVPRRLLLGVTLGVFSAGTLVTALAADYGVLLAVRLVVGLTQALFWSVVGSTATGLFPPSRRGRTVARMSMGAALAPVLGVPIGTWLGQQAGWRFAFLVMAVLGVITCAAVVTLLPGGSTAQSEAAARGSAPDTRRYLLLVLCTAIAVTGAVTAQTYVTPFLLDVTGFAPATLGPLLLVTGTAGFFGTVVVGRFLDRYPWLALVIPMALTVVALLALYLLGTLRPAAIAALALNGFAFSAMAAAIQNRTLQVAPGSTDLASAGTGSAFNVGIASGSFLGGLIIDRAGVHAVTLAGALITAAAVALLLTEPRLARATKRDDGDEAAHRGRPGEAINVIDRTVVPPARCAGQP